MLDKAPPAGWAVRHSVMVWHVVAPVLDLWAVGCTASMSAPPPAVPPPPAADLHKR